MSLSIIKNKENKSNMNGQKIQGKALQLLQEIGKTLQFPITVLAFAAILLRFGALGINYTIENGVITNEVGYWISYIIEIGGKAVFDNIALWFAIGVAFGLAKDYRGEVALAGAVFYLVLFAMTSIAGSLPEMFYGHKEGLVYFKDGMKIIEESEGVFKKIPNMKYILNIGALGGIVAGGLSAWLHNKYSTINLPKPLSFFGGRRFVLMGVLILVLPVGLLFAVIWPWIQFGLFKFGTYASNHMDSATPLTAIYGVINRLLLPFGLDEISSDIFWNQLNSGFENIISTSGEIIGKVIGGVDGDINAFAKGIENSGLFQSGFFPIMMGGIPAIALAMILTAKPENRSNVITFLGGTSLVSVISGITQPIEFSFAFISPLLYSIHSLLTGVFMAITTAMGIQIGFDFSAGLIDYIISFSQSWGFAVYKESILANPLWTLALTAIAAGSYLLIFMLLIKKLNIKTIGREDNVTKNVNKTKSKTTSQGKRTKATQVKKPNIKT
ncbi:MAG: PTS transporter subunit EIIC [Spiroplasma sp.]|nr:PTS transporter subunit EIIC [Spiroplasma sp.]